MIFVIILALAFVGALYMFVRYLQTDAKTATGAWMGVIIVLAIILGSALESIVP